MSDVWYRAKEEKIKPGDDYYVKGVEMTAYHCLQKDGTWHIDSSHSLCILFPTKEAAEEGGYVAILA